MVISYELLGKLFVFLVIFVIFVTGVALLFGAYSIKKHKIIFPNYILFMLYLFYSPAKWICMIFSIKEELVDEILIEVRNAVMLDKFKKTNGRRAVILPQCMRHPECKSRCDPIMGYECTKCGKCEIKCIVESADKYNFKVFIVPGDSFVRKIIKSYNPKACLGVACYIELTESMQAVSKFMPVQGVCLMRDGCFDTKVDVAEVIHKMELCDDI